MALITRVELRDIEQRRSQQDLLNLLPRVHELLDELGAPSLQEEVDAALEAAEKQAKKDAAKATRASRNS